MMLLQHLEALKTLGIKIKKNKNIWEVFGNGIGNLSGSGLS